MVTPPARAVVVTAMSFVVAISASVARLVSFATFTLGAVGIARAIFTITLLAAALYLLLLVLFVFFFILRSVGRQAKRAENKSAA